jgi:hypothetical protein
MAKIWTWPIWQITGKIRSKKTFECIIFQQFYWDHLVLEATCVIFSISFPLWSMEFTRLPLTSRVLFSNKNVSAALSYVRSSSPSFSPFDVQARSAENLSPATARDGISPSSTSLGPTPWVFNAVRYKRNRWSHSIRAADACRVAVYIEPRTQHRESRRRWQE